MSFDTLALGSLRLSVVRRVVIGFPQPPHQMTHWRWIPSTSASFDTLSLGSLRLRVFRHVDVRFLPPRRHSTRWCWVPSASVSFDTLALGSLHIGVVRHIGVGFLRLRVFRHVDLGSPSPPSLGGCLPPRLVRDGLAAPSCGSRCHRGSATWGLDLPRHSWSAWSSWGRFRQFHQWKGC